MNSMIDLVLINPGDHKWVFQDLANDLSAYEPPFWIAVMASYLRTKGLSVAIIDSNVENISPDETANRVRGLNPILVAVIVYGSNPSSSTQNMTIAEQICSAVKSQTDGKVAIGGLHPSALPKLTLEESEVDYVIEGEGPYTLETLLSVLKKENRDYSKVPGLWYKEDGEVRNNPRAPLIENLDQMLPIGAWDLLPMHKYKAHNWHCFDDISKRTPYGALYTSLGCPFSCTFCCINAPFGKPGIRYRSPQLVVDEIGVLVEKYGVKNLKIVDELFILREDHYMKIVELIIERGYDLNIWAYARVDTLKPENFKAMKKAGINWLALGIESASALVRDGSNKQMRKKEILQICRQIQSAGIYVGANYIFGLPDDTLETMNETIALAMEINSEWANFYCAMAYPGSKLYNLALDEGWELPNKWHNYSPYAYDLLPLRSKHVEAKDILRFRDEAFNKYFENPKYLSMLEKKFGVDVRKHVGAMTMIRLKRKLLGDK